MKQALLVFTLLAVAIVAMLNEWTLTAIVLALAAAILLLRGDR